MPSAMSWQCSPQMQSMVQDKSQADRDALRARQERQLAGARSRRRFSWFGWIPGDEGQAEGEQRAGGAHPAE